MSSLPFREIFGINAQPQNACEKYKIEIPYPPRPEISELYEKLIQTCADPQSLSDLLNNQISNHVRSGAPDHYVSYDLSQMISPFLTILPYILSDRAIIAQAHEYKINVINYLSQWQYFAFQSFFSYFQHILSSKVYIGDSRHWLITTIFDLLCQNKTVYSHSIVTRVRIKDKAFKEKTVFHAVIKPNREITIYSNNTCVKKGILKFQADRENPTHQIEEYTKDKLIYQAKLILLEPDGEKITPDSAERFFNEGITLNHLLWACMSTKESNFSYEAFDAIAKMIIGFNGEFIHLYYYTQPIDGLFESLMKIAIFIHRHIFVLKTLIWAIFDESKDISKLFKSSFPPIKYLISFIKSIIQPQLIKLVNQIMEYIDIYQNDLDKPFTDKPLNDIEFKRGIIKRFWDVCFEISKTFPKTLFDVCSHLYIFSDMVSGDPNRNPYTQIKDLLFSEIIIPFLFDYIRETSNKSYKECLNFVVKSIAMTAAYNKQDEFSLLGFDSLQIFLEFVSQPSTELNIKDIDIPTIPEFIESVKIWIDCIKGSADFIRKMVELLDSNENITSSSSFIDPPDENDNFSETQLPVLKKRRASRHGSGAPILLKDCDSSSHHFQSFKTIPSTIVPWKTRLARDIFYSYYLELQEKQ